MAKQMKVEDINLDAYVGDIRYMDIDVFRFAYDKNENELVQVILIVNEENEFLDEIYERVDNDKDLKRIALNWIFDNVKICTADEISNSCKIN